jgi:hypothetical protein
MPAALYMELNKRALICSDSVDGVFLEEQKPLITEAPGVTESFLSKEIQRRNNDNHTNSIQLSSVNSFLCLAAAKQGQLLPRTKTTVQDEII